MKQKSKVSSILLVVLFITAMAAILLVWPVQAWKDHITVATQDEAYMISEAVTQDSNVMQEFIPAYSHVDQIQIRIAPLTEEPGKFMFRFYDKDLTLLWEADRSFADSREEAYFTFPIEMQLHVGEPYYYTLNYIDKPFAVCYDETQALGQNDNGSFYYALQEIPNSAAITSYHYIVDYSVQKILLCDGMILLLFFVLTILLILLRRYTDWDKEVSTDRAIHVIVGILVIAVTLYAMWQAGVKQIFNHNPIDITVYLIGILLCGITLYYAGIQIRTKQIRLNKNFLCHKLLSYLRIGMVCLAILACKDFVNAGSNYAQGLALREVCIYLGLFMIAMFTKPELCRIHNAIYALVAAGAGVYYCYPYLGQGEPYETAIRTAIMVAVWGLIVIDTIYNMIHKNIAKISPFYTIAVGVFFLFLILFRHGNVWELAIVIPFTLLYLRRMDAAQREHFLQTVEYGIILSFCILTMQALWHRPFHYYMMIRYSGIFSTVTVTAVYLVLVFAVAVNRFLQAYHRSPKLHSIWKELVLLGVVCGYQFLTLSRTGILTCVGVYIIALVIYLCFHNRRLADIGRYLLYTLLAVIWFIPVVFTATRMIPPLVNDPIIYDGELFLDSIKKGEPIDSFRQITVERFLGLSTERILGKADLDHVTQSGKTVEEALEEAADSTSEVLTESGVTVHEETITYIDQYGSEYTIETPGYSNGRLDIYKQYLQHLNMAGHDAVGLPQEDGTTIVHAHNSFIQMAYDCGIITGILFLLLYVLLGCRTIRYYRVRRDIDQHAMLPLIIFAAFGISSMVEYVFRPTIPLGFVFLLMFMPLLTRFESDRSTYEE